MDRSVTVISRGAGKFTLDDDLVTNSRVSLAGRAMTLSEGAEEPIWRPTKLLLHDPRMKPFTELAAASPDSLTVPDAALEALEAGGVVHLKLDSQTVKLSELPRLTRAARGSAGHLVIELHGDG